MKRILFLIHDLGQGGAEKVLVNLVNHMDTAKFDVSVTALFGGGINEQFLAPHIHFKAVFPCKIPGNSKLMKVFSPQQLHRLCVKEEYDLEVSYLEGPSARVISGCPCKDTKLIAWIHSTITTSEEFADSFRNMTEAVKCYKRFDCISFVSQDIKKAFLKFVDLEKTEVIYNTIESKIIVEQSKESAPELVRDSKLRLIVVGSLKNVKGYGRLLEIFKRLVSKRYKIHLYILGTGPLEKKLKQFVTESGLTNDVTFLGYQTNPYKYLAKCDIFICSSYSEGFSTAATEALILGIPVLTVEVSGMKEMLGEHNEYGIVVENSDQALYEGIRQVLDTPDLLKYYKHCAELRGKDFSTERTVASTEKMFERIIGKSK